jgi:hypothetical protein
MHSTPWRRTTGAAILAVLAGAASASPAAAQARCTAPDEPGWHSCLTTAHRAIDGGPAIRLTMARPRLVMRVERCPERNERRRVVVRTDDGERLAHAGVRSRCRRGVARWSVDLRLDVDLTEGAVVLSYWSGIPDSSTAPGVELTG